MTVESNDAVTISRLTDWLQNFAPIFQPTRSRIETNRTLYACFQSRAMSKLQIIARNCHWFIALFGPVVIGGIN